MPGHGPPPKDESVRRRRNKPPELDELPPEGNAGKVPPLRATYGVEAWDPKSKRHKIVRVKFLPATRAWYEAWARSPMATEFADVHWRRLADIAVLQDRWFRSSDLEVLKELRLQLASFGGTPADLRRLGKSVKPPGGGEKPAAAAGGNRRARLTAVPDAV